MSRNQIDRNRAFIQSICREKCVRNLLSENLLINYTSTKEEQSTILHQLIHQTFTVLYCFRLTDLSRLVTHLVTQSDTDQRSDSCVGSRRSDAWLSEGGGGGGGGFGGGGLGGGGLGGGGGGDGDDGRDGGNGGGCDGRSRKQSSRTRDRQLLAVLNVDLARGLRGAVHGFGDDVACDSDAVPRTTGSPASPRLTTVVVSAGSASIGAAGTFRN